FFAQFQNEDFVLDHKVEYQKKKNIIANLIQNKFSCDEKICTSLRNLHERLSIEGDAKVAKARGLVAPTLKEMTLVLEQIKVHKPKFDQLYRALDELSKI